ncbi:MAG TPA: hypothetical protein VNC59_03870 [Thermoanaerobaculia bacterium]|nr:hypothetical protein [Thermoanaerobaculia bacterium]
MTPLLLWLALGQSPPPAPPPPGSRAFKIDEEVRKLAFRPLWPGFDPAKVPLAIFDGQRTFLFRHPKPPPEFQRVADRPDTAVVAGRHELLRANTSVAMGDVRTATLLADAPREGSVRDSAAIAVHEAFHVFQAARHPKWGGNEVDLFTYPMDDPVLLQGTRLETEALRRSLPATREKTAACWAAAALDVRRTRFAALGEAATLYERGTELKEGLARLVESRARGSAQEPVFPASEFAAGDVRSRSYAVGHAFGILLDRFAPGWEVRLEDGGDEPLDVLLLEALAARKTGRSCRFSAQETARALDGAKKSLELARLTREAIREDFFRTGWKLVIVSEAEPLSPQGFDPLNVERLAPGEVLHTRWVKLGNSKGSLEVLNARAVTESAGRHPLFEGVRRVTVAGLGSEPELRESAAGLAVEAAGVTARFAGSRWERKDRTTTVHVSKSP